MNITTWIGNTQMPKNETGTQRSTKVQGKQDDLTFGALLRDTEQRTVSSNTTEWSLSAITKTTRLRSGI